MQKSPLQWIVVDSRESQHNLRQGLRKGRGREVHRYTTSLLASWLGHGNNALIKGLLRHVEEQGGGVQVDAVLGLRDDRGNLLGGTQFPENLAIHFNSKI